MRIRHALGPVFVVLGLAGATARATPTPLADPIPGTIPVGPYTARLAEVATGLVFPTNVRAAPDGSDRQFITLRNGIIRVLKNGALLPTPFLDISATTVLDAGSALSSMVFHPRFAVSGDPANGKFYTVSQEAAGTAPANFGAISPVAHQNVVYEWRVSSSNGDVADPSTRREIVRINSKTTVHNVDDLAFGPDGYLYISKGDDDATVTTGPDGTTVNGTVMRINVDDTSGNGRYTVPADNPFVADASGRIAEIYAYGFRNPWRITFHPLTGALYLGDIGEDDIEEIDVVKPGLYYGWILKEGSFAFLNFTGVTNDLSILPPGFNGVDPVAEYDHTEGDGSITGGLFYRGSAVPSLVGHYVFGDFISSRLMEMDPVTRQIRRIAIDPSGAALGQNLIGIGETGSHELLIVVTNQNTTATGRVLRIVGGSGPPADADGDTVPDGLDNCVGLGNPTQLDSDADGYGNICDPDFNNDGVVNINDLNRLKSRLNIVPVVDLATDLDGNGAVNINDLNRLKSFLGKPPGPSAVVR
jgi:glucose/arabinose dehydrogenase